MKKQQNISEEDVLVLQKTNVISDILFDIMPNVIEDRHKATPARRLTLYQETLKREALKHLHQHSQNTAAQHQFPYKITLPTINEAGEPSSSQSPVRLKKR